MLAMTEGVGWRSLRNDDENDKFTSGLRQTMTVENVYRNARDDRGLVGDRFALTKKVVN
jgi:hypothetical protein